MLGKLERLIDQIIGVIDLRHGAAVHAIAGNRDGYRPIQWCEGSPIQLADHYRRIGVSRIYIADLDAILGSAVQTKTLVEIANHFSGAEVLLDIGWRGGISDQRRAVKTIMDETRSTHFIAATETVRRMDAIAELVGLADSQRTFLGLDLCGGILADQLATEADWTAVAVDQKLKGIVVLDVRQVGTSAGPVTGPRCRRLKSECTQQLIYSGGGVRSFADIGGLLESGCDACLVATALHHQ